MKPPEKFRFKVSDKVETAAVLVLAIGFYIILLLVNSQNIIGPHSLFMDEKLIYDGVLSIVKPESLSSFIHAISDGGDQRYGRLLWNVIALISFAPSIFWGESAIIFVERMIGGTAILFAYLILARIFIKNLLLRILLIVVLFMLPFTLYYSTTPKPEPLMLLFLSLYLRYSFEKRKFLGSHWIYLGLIFGLKISGIFIVATVFAYTLCEMIRSRTWPKIDQMLKSFSLFLVGVAISVPTLFSLAIFGMLLYSFSEHKVAKAVVMGLRLTLFVALGLSIKPSVDFVRNYYAWTFNSTQHGADSDDVSVTSWMRYIFDLYFNSSTLSIILLGVVLIWIQLFLHRRKDVEYSKKFHLASLLFLFTTIPIILSVERLWGFYLWIGSIFLTCAIAINIQRAMFLVSNPHKIILISTNVMLIFILNLHTNFVAQVKSLSTIETSGDFILQQKRYKEIIEMLTEISSKTKVRFSVAYDPILWVPSSTNQYEIKLFWGPFIDWNSRVDLVVMTSGHLQDEIDFSRGDSSIRILEVEGFKNHLIEDGEKCLVNNCYTAHASFYGVTILKIIK